MSQTEWWTGQVSWSVSERCGFGRAKMKSYKLLAITAVILVQSLLLLAQDPPNLQNGLPPQGVFDGSSADSVNLMNGNVIMHIPLPVSVPQRGKLSIQYYLIVNAKTWKAYSNQPVDGNQQWTYTGGLGALFTSTASFTMTRNYTKVWTDGQQPDFSVGTPDTV